MDPRVIKGFQQDDQLQGEERKAEVKHANLRDEFAKAAMPAHIDALKSAQPPNGQTWYEMISKLSYLTADAMLAARSAQPTRRHQK